MPKYQICFSHTKKAHHSACGKGTEPVLSRYGQVGLIIYAEPTWPTWQGGVLSW